MKTSPVTLAFSLLVLVVTCVPFEVRWARAERALAMSAEELKARKIGREGIKAFDLGETAKAIEFFEEAYRTYPLPTLLYNLAQVHRKEGGYEKAIDLYRSYLRTVAKISAKERKDIERKIEELAKLLEAQRQARRSPPEGVRVEPAASPPLAPVLTSKTVVPQRTEPPSRWYQDTLGWVTLAAGAGLAGLTAYLVLSSNDLNDKVAITPEGPMRDELRSSATTRRTVGTVTGVAGGLLVLGGVAILIIQPRPQPQEQSASQTSVSIGLGWVSVQGSF